MAIERTVLTLDDLGERLPDLGSTVDHAARDVGRSSSATCLGGNVRPTTTIGELRSIAECADHEAFAALDAASSPVW